MRQGRDDRDAKCPYLIGHGDTFIVCESVFPRDTGATCRTQYKGARELQRQYGMYCCANWQRCEQARSIAHWRYADDDD